jgi:CheY-like chemotaxis protein
MDQVEFSHAVKDALNHYHDPAYLENHALIQCLLSESELKQVNRVQLLRAKIKDSIGILHNRQSSLPDEEPDPKDIQERSYLTLTYRYLRKMDMHRIEDSLGLSNRQVQRELKKGLDAVVSLLWNQQVPRTVPERQVELPAELVQSSELDLIKEELKAWQIHHDPVSLAALVQEALQLRRPTGALSLLDAGDLAQKGQVNVYVDYVLTKQGLYKLFDLLQSAAEPLPFTIHIRKLNERFVELAILCASDFAIEKAAWETAGYFFTLQGLKVEESRQDNRLTIRLVLPLMQQNNCIVIDDVVSVHRLIERMLGPYGIQVFGASTYKEALELAQIIKPDFMLLDILMPEMDGWQMLKAFKDDPTTRAIPVIISSVMFEPELAEAVGAAAYIRKPINRLELLKTLKSVGLIEAIHEADLPHD